MVLGALGGPWVCGAQGKPVGASAGGVSPGPPGVSAGHCLVCSWPPTSLTSSQDGLWVGPQHPHLTDEKMEAEGGTVTGPGHIESEWQDSCDVCPHYWHPSAPVGPLRPKGQKGCGQQAAAWVTSICHPHWKRGPRSSVPRASSLRVDCTEPAPWRPTQDLWRRSCWGPDHAQLGATGGSTCHSPSRAWWLVQRRPVPS